MTIELDTKDSDPQARSSTIATGATLSLKMFYGCEELFPETPSLRPGKRWCLVVADRKDMWKDPDAVFSQIWSVRKYSPAR